MYNTTQALHCRALPGTGGPSCQHLVVNDDEVVVRAKASELRRAEELGNARNEAGFLFLFCF